MEEMNNERRELLKKGMIGSAAVAGVALLGRFFNPMDLLKTMEPKEEKNKTVIQEIKNENGEMLVTVEED